ncbi:hypothetical protein ACWGNE_00150 [Streptomyces xiamenensis]
MESLVMEGGLGRAGHPGPGWWRLRWAELARRTGDSVIPDGLLPSYRCFPHSRRKAVGHWTSLGAVDLDNLHVLSGRLGDAWALYEHPGIDFGPSNLWTRDRSWVLCTDYDLWAIKVAGPREVIDVILDDPTLEGIRLPRAL